MAEYISHSLEETKVVAQKVLDTGARIIALQGDLGAGKTALTKCIAEILGITETVTSPTYVIMKKYAHISGTLIHIDAYRLESGKELEDLKYKELLDTPENFIIIEWPERVAGILPAETLTVRCDFVDEMTRKYIF